MPAKPKLAIDTEAHVLAHAAKGKSYAWISRWLKRAHAITISEQAIGKMVKQTRRARADVAAAVVRGELQQKLPEDLQIFDGHMRALRAELAKIEVALSRKRTSDRAFSKLSRLQDLKIRELRQCLDMKLHYVGADQPEERNSIDGLADFLGRGFASPKPKRQ